MAGADKTAFRALMRHLKQADPERTVLMVQVENESGVWGGVRDYGPEAEKPLLSRFRRGLSQVLENSRLMEAGLRR